MEIIIYKWCCCLLQVYDYGDNVIMPGLIDANVNCCSGTDLEDFSSITKAAAAGGFTTIVDNPLWVNLNWNHNEMVINLIF